MSRTKIKGFQSSTISRHKMSPRHSRHGRVQVGLAPRNFEDQRRSPYWKEAVVLRERIVSENPATGMLEVTVKETVVSPERPMTQEEVDAARSRVLRADHSTTPGGSKNLPENMAPRGKAGAKSSSEKRR